MRNALAFYDKALSLKPDHAEAHNNRGNALLNLKRHGAALASYDAALRVRPDYADALSNRGNALLDLKQYEDAARTFQQLLRHRSRLRLRARQFAGGATS